MLNQLGERDHYERTQDKDHVGSYGDVNIRLQRQNIILVSTIYGNMVDTNRRKQLDRKGYWW